MLNAELGTDYSDRRRGAGRAFSGERVCPPGLRWRIVEARPTQSTHSKALAIFLRTLEIFDMPVECIPACFTVSEYEVLNPVVLCGNRRARIGEWPEPAIHARARPQVHHDFARQAR